MPAARHLSIILKAPNLVAKLSFTVEDNFFAGDNSYTYEIFRLLNSEK